MGYLLEPSGIVKLTNVFQPAELQTMGSNPLTIYSKKKLIPFYIVLNLTTGTIPYNFSGPDHITFFGLGGQFFDSTYTLQTIQNDEYVVGYARSEFKIGTLGTNPSFDLTLSTINGNDATQGDGVLTVLTYCVRL